MFECSDTYTVAGLMFTQPTFTVLNVGSAFSTGVAQREELASIFGLWDDIT
jgi:hypothetical protein